MYINGHFIPVIFHLLQKNCTTTIDFKRKVHMYVNMSKLMWQYKLKQKVKLKVNY